MTKVTVRAPVKEMVLAAPLPLLAGWFLANRQFALAATFAVAGFVVLMLLVERWRRNVAPEIRSSSQPGKPRPYVDVAWPRWLVNGWIVFVASALALLFVVLVALTVAKAIG
jgi:hypothetical protein